jgi:hypothetical protein
MPSKPPETVLIDTGPTLPDTLFDEAMTSPDVSRQFRLA